MFKYYLRLDNFWCDNCDFITHKSKFKIEDEESFVIACEDCGCRIELNNKEDLKKIKKGKKDE